MRSLRSFTLFVPEQYGKYPMDLFKNSAATKKSSGKTHMRCENYGGVASVYEEKKMRLPRTTAQPAPPKQSLTMPFIAHICRSKDFINLSMFGKL